MVSSFVQRSLSGIGIFVVVLVCVLLGKVAIHLLWAFCQICMFYELKNAISHVKKAPFVPYWGAFIAAYSFGASIIFETELTPYVSIYHLKLFRAIAIMVSIAAFCALLFQATLQTLKEDACLASFLIVTITMICVFSQFDQILIRDEPLLFLHQFALVAVNDCFAYFCGKLLGKFIPMKLIRVSPSKTMIGFVGAAVFTILLAQPTLGLLHKYVPLQGEFNNAQQLIFAIYCAIIAPTGGFYASLLKRAVGIKDFSNIIPGHGGILDRCDCQIMSGLVLWAIRELTMQ